MPSNDLFRRLIHSRIKQVPVLMNGPLNYWLKWFKIQKRVSIINKTLCVAQTCLTVLLWSLFELFSLTKMEQKQSKLNSNIELKCIFTTRFNSCIKCFYIKLSYICMFLLRAVALICFDFSTILFLIDRLHEPQLARSCCYWLSIINSHL